MRATVKEPLGSSVNIPVDERKGPSSIVYFTRDLSPRGLRKIYQKEGGVSWALTVIWKLP